MLSPKRLPRRYFTPDEANTLLPTIRAYLLEVQQLGRAVHALERALDQGPPESERRELERVRAERAWSQAHLVERLLHLGVELSDPIESGRLRFPALRNGEPVWLMWTVGEPRVRTWMPASYRLGGHGPTGRPRSPGLGAHWEWRN